MLYDTPEGANTPFIPPLPSPEAAVQPPLIPTPDHREPPPAWAQQPRTPMHYPYYPATPYNTTPFIPPMPSMQGTPAVRVDPPGSYYPAPSALPGVYAPPVPGVSADFTGYPTLNGTPWAPPQPIPPPNAMPPPPWPGQHPATAYNAFNQPLPGGQWGPPVGGPPMGGLPMGGPPMGGLPMGGPPMGYTPAAAAWPMHPGMTPHQQYAGHTPWVGTTLQPPPMNIPVPQNDTVRAAFRWQTNADRMDPFAEGPHYGPVLQPFVAKVLGAAVRLNPLLAPPADNQDDYLRWNMLFDTGNCYRTSQPRRSWVKGRKAPATHPRMTHIRIISRAFPWMIHARAQDPKIGVTCGEVLDALSAYMYGDVAKKEYESMSASRKRQVWANYQLNRSTGRDVPGGRLGESLKRLDWLGPASRFGGLVINDTFAKEHCGDVLPSTFELKCLPSYPMTPDEFREQQQRSTRRRSRSSRSSRAPSPFGPDEDVVVVSSELEEEEED
ncbi:hypothetical protein BDN67DRAFT_707349 [Paxillus ammoniavirescens]|nr:hypothetical protein BDN67DRAFT_707349 [Paxillus ammoniavirescens]